MTAIFRHLKLLLLWLPASIAAAAPIAYSVNSDAPDGDSLYQIDLGTGQETLIGQLQSLGVVRSDTEGLAIDRYGVLWGVDDESQKLFPINTSNGSVEYEAEVGINGIGTLSGNDFGMTFTCSGDLYVTSVSTHSLYRLSLDGTATLIGSVGALGANISAIAAWGSPTKLYALGNGLISEGGPTDNRSLFTIDLDTGVAHPVGTVGPAVADYYQAGLSFDSEGTLWAITDRRGAEQTFGSQILTLDTETGQATLHFTTTGVGYESLAVAAPGGCSIDPGIPIDGFGDPNQIPTLGGIGKALAALALLALGWVTLRRRMARR